MSAARLASQRKATVQKEVGPGGRKQPVEVSKLIHLLQPKLEKQDLKAALLQVKGLVDRIYRLEEEVAQLQADAAARPALDATPPSAVDSLADLPTECLIAVLRWTGTLSRRAVCAASTGLALAVREGRARRLWSEGLYCIAGGGGPGSELSLEQYSAVRDRWTLLGPVPSIQAGAAACLVAATHRGAVVDKRIYVTGGSATTTAKGVRSVIPHTKHVQVFNTQSRAWEQGRPMLIARSGHVAAYSQGMVVVIGGMGKKVVMLSATEAFDPSAGAWRNLAPMPTPRCMASAVATPSGIVVIGGHTEDGPTTAVELFQPGAGPGGQWTRLCPTLHPHSGGGAALLPGAEQDRFRIAMIGGAERFVELYDSEADTWTELPALPGPRTQCGAVCIDATVHAIGGLASKQAKPDTGLPHRTRYGPWTPHQQERSEAALLVPVPAHQLQLEPLLDPSLDTKEAEWKVARGWGKPGAALAFAS